MKHFAHGGHRKPPASIHWNSEAGVCRWCGCCIHKKDGSPNFKNWHHRCFTEYSRLFWPTETRKYLFKLRGNNCEICGKPVTLRSQIIKDENGRMVQDPLRKNRWLKSNRAEHHHIIPLIDYNHSIEDPWAAWRPDNLILLCHECHMAEHKKLRQIGKQVQLGFVE